MKKLFSVEFQRAILSPLLWVVACILIMLNVFGMVLNSYGFTITASTFLFCNTPIICVSVIATLFTMITMIMHKRLNSIAVALCLTILGLQLGGKTVSALKQEVYHVDKDETTVENTLYLEGFERTLANGHVLFSPFAQVKINQICDMKQTI